MRSYRHSSQLVHLPNALPNGTFKRDCFAFVQAVKKQFSSQKNDNYAQVETLTLVKKDIESVRHFGLKVKQLVQ